MTMHLAQGLSTISTKKKKKSKITKSQMERYQKELLKYNRKCKREGRHSERMTIEEYIDYVHGIVPKKKTEPHKTETYKPTETYRRNDVSHIPSLDSNEGGVCGKAEPKVYTGTLVKGICQTHKSNAVPVINDEEIIDIRHMRR